MEKAANGDDNAVERYSERVVAAVLGFAETASIALGDALGW